MAESITITAAVSRFAALITRARRARAQKMRRERQRAKSRRKRRGK
ncbi:MAG: hypothetical protein AB7D37_11230 [Desulfovibrio sp.]